MTTSEETLRAELDRVRADLNWSNQLHDQRDKIERKRMFGTPPITAAKLNEAIDRVAAYLVERDQRHTDDVIHSLGDGPEPGPQLLNSDLRAMFRDSERLRDVNSQLRYTLQAKEHRHSNETATLKWLHAEAVHKNLEAENVAVSAIVLMNRVGTERDLALWLLAEAQWRVSGFDTLTAELARRNRSLEDMSQAARTDNLRIVRALGLGEAHDIDDVVTRAAQLFERGAVTGPDARPAGWKPKIGDPVIGKCRGEFGPDPVGKFAGELRGTSRIEMPLQPGQSSHFAYVDSDTLRPAEPDAERLPLLARTLGSLDEEPEAHGG